MNCLCLEKISPLLTKCFEFWDPTFLGPLATRGQNLTTQSQAHLLSKPTVDPHPCSSQGKAKSYNTHELG